MSTAQDIAAQVNKAFGAGTVKLGKDVKPVSHWSTGILPMDVMLDGGLPVGRFTDVYGDFSTLKSYLALTATAATQAAGGLCAYVDTEHAFDSEWAVEQGVDIDTLLVQQPETGEEAIGVMEALLRSGYDLVVWDSIAATQPKQYAEKKPGEDTQVAGQARMMSAGLRRLNSVNRHTAILAINQTRVDVGLTYGSKVTTPGGKALPFYASYRLRMIKAGQESEDVMVWNGEKLEKAKQRIIQKIKVQMEKSKLSSPSREAWMMFDLRTGEVDEIAFITGWLVEEGYVTIKAAQRGPATYTIEETSVRGREKFMQYIAQDEELLEWAKTELTKDFNLASPGSHGPVAKSKGGRQSDESSESEGQ